MLIFSTSGLGLRILLLNMKNPTIATATRTPNTIPTTAPALRPLLFPEPEFEFLSLPDLRGFREPGGAGGAGPELHELPPFLKEPMIYGIIWTQKIFSTQHNPKVQTPKSWSVFQCLLQIYVLQLLRNPSGEMVICNIPKKYNDRFRNANNRKVLIKLIVYGQGTLTNSEEEGLQGHWLCLWTGCFANTWIKLAVLTKGNTIEGEEE